MARSARAILFYQFSAAFVTLLAGVLAATDANTRNLSCTTKKAFSICMAVLFFISIDAKLFSMSYVKRLKWVIKSLGGTERNPPWFVAVMMLVSSTPFLNVHSVVPIAVLAALSTNVILVVGCGWDCDNSGMTEGLLVGLAKILIVTSMSSKWSQAIICGLVIVLAVVFKVEGQVAENKNGNSLSLF